AGADLITHESAPRIAASAVGLELGGELQQEVVELCVDAMAPQFSSYAPSDLAVLPSEVFQALLLRDDLEVANEDDVFDFLRKVSGQLDSNSMSQLWRHCRLHQLSRERVLEAALIEEIPKAAIVWAMAQLRPATACKTSSCVPPWASELAACPASPRGREISFRVQCPTGFASKKSLRSRRHGPRWFRWRLLVFPLGTECTGTPRQVAAFVEVVPDADVVSTWKLKHVKYSITVVNWRDERLSVTKEHVVDFSASEVPPETMTSCQGWLSESGELCFRARCCVRGATAVGVDLADTER
ncbi:unnamed protein product, partial [Prorocentrum cordatum]